MIRAGLYADRERDTVWFCLAFKATRLTGYTGAAAYWTCHLLGMVWAPLPRVRLLVLDLVEPSIRRWAMGYDWRQWAWARDWMEGRHG